MNLLKDSAEQIRSAFLSMPMASRMIAIMLVIIITVGLGILVRGSKNTDSTYLFGGESFNDQELAEMELAFAEARLSNWTRENKRLRVPSDSVHEYLRALAESGKLPTRLESAVTSALEKSNPLELNDQFKFRTQHARLEDLGRRIQMFRDVKWAEVQYDSSEKGWSSQHRHTASVTVMPEGDEPLSPARERQIRELVKYSFADLKLEDVVVIDTNASTAGAWKDEENELLATKRRVEGDLELRIRKLLRDFGDIRLLVTADIDPILRSQTTTVEYNERTPQDEQSRKLEIETSKGPSGGVPGVGPNALAENQRMSLNDSTVVSTTKDETRASRGLVDQTYEQSETAPLLVRRVKVSIGLPKTYYETIYRSEYLKQNPETAVSEIPPMTPEQYAKRSEEIKTTIRSAVAILLSGVEAGEDRLKLVEVWDYDNLPVASLELPNVSDQALSWLAGSWQTLALVFLALVALLVARSVARSVAPPAPAAFEQGFGLEIPADAPSSEGGQENSENGPGMKITGGSLKAELTELIEKNPDVAANVLRAWIGDAA